MMWAIKAYEHAEIYFNVSTLKFYFYKKLTENLYLLPMLSESWFDIN